MQKSKWKKGFVKDLISSLTAGVSVNGESTPAKKQEKGVLKVSSVSYGRFLPQENKKILEQDLHRAKTTPQKNTIIISRSNTPALVGASVYIEKDYPNLFLPDKLWQTKSKPEAKFSLKWLFYSLNTERSRFLLSAQATGSSSSMCNITKEEFLNLPIDIPPYQEQLEIEKRISAWDKAITQTQQLIEAKQKYLLWLREQLINPEDKSGWRWVKLGQLLSESRILGSTGADAKKLTVKLYGKGVIPKSEKRSGSSNTKFYIRKSGQFIYSKLDFLNGAFGIIPPVLDGYESTLDLPAFDISDDVLGEWLLHFFSRPSFYESQKSLAKGQRKARRINPTDLLELEIQIPPKKYQFKSVAILNACKSEIGLLKHKDDYLKVQKKGLMQKLLTGKVRVKVDY